MNRKLRSRWNEERIRRATGCSVGLLALLLASVAFSTDVNACPVYHYDYGDAPVSYQTLTVHGGAEHRIDWDFHLGGSIDAEDDGQPWYFALGDDLFDYDDEDGVEFLTPLTAGEEADLGIFLTNDDGLDAYLNAWVDFNADGDWNDPGEQIFTDEPLNPGANPLSFLVPGLADGASLGATYARFRLNSGGGLDYYGPACDGEVEDYMISIVPEPAALSLMALGLTGLAAFRRLCE